LIADEQKFNFKLIDTTMSLTKILIDGEWRETAKQFPVRSPYSGELLADVCTAGAEEIEVSIASALAASLEMRKLARFQLAPGLRAISAGIESRKDVFARTMALESAKPMIYARGEIERAIATFAWAAGEAERFTGEIVPIDAQPNGRGKRGRTIRRPRGVIYGITPFNFPLNLVAHKVAPALAAGNAIIIKPSPRTPLSSLLLGEVFLESGLPIRALQIVPADVKNIAQILNDDRVSMISFTGSAAVGWDIKNRAGKKAIALELGGNAPVIVDETADLEKSLSRTVTGAFAYSGQVCISVQRVYVHENRFDQWTENFVERAKALKTGDPLNDDTRISVMIDEDAAKRAETWANEAVDNGAKILAGGNREGSFLDATIITNTDPEMRIVAEEVFAPIVVLEKFGRFQEAVDMANNSKYGLQAGVFSNDQANIDFAAENLEYGGVIINDAPIFRVDNMPYGGMKESGYGREGVRYAMDEMSEIRLIVTENHL
jgi:acyl-CoA reductase-like NAD-dependent aldehyde dehydrogenase